MASAFSLSRLSLIKLELLGLAAALHSLWLNLGLPDEAVLPFPTQPSPQPLCMYYQRKPYEEVKLRIMLLDSDLPKLDGKPSWNHS